MIYVAKFLSFLMSFRLESKKFFSKFLIQLSIPVTLIPSEVVHLKN